MPRVTDDRLELILFAEDPEIVTPIGAVVDSRDRLFVLESHTHSRPRDYQGPATDRVKVFEDVDADGRSDRSWVFADGLHEGLNLAFSAEGTLYAVCSHSVVALYDEDRDGVCETRETILRLDTRDRNPHGCLLSITFSADGWMYVGRGNTGGRAWTLHGTDGSRVSGYGDGGNIVRCRPDGSHVEEFATGFWNPMGLHFDHAGRLLCADNDPDARGPNRLVHVVTGGDYGYRSLFGGGGNHPYQGWDGDLPGTLPYVSGTGEAPSGLIDCRFARLPMDYRDSVLVTVWNENTIERHRLTPRGASLAGERSVLVQGGKDFRPVAFAADSRGNLYFTDWVLVAYPNHSRGRIWRLSMRKGVETVGPAEADPQSASAEGDDANDESAIAAALATDDPFAHHAAVMLLASEEFDDDLRVSLASRADARVRLGSLLALKRRGVRDEAIVRSFLEDPDSRVRRAALIWAGDAGITGLRPALEIVLAQPNTTGALVETYIATVPLLDEEFIAALRERRGDYVRSLVPDVENEVLRNVVLNESLSADVRALVLDRLEVGGEDAAWLIELASSDSAIPLQRAAVNRLGSIPSPEASRALWQVAEDVSRDARTRGDAIAAVARTHTADASRLVRLLDDDEPHVQVAAARALRLARWSNTEREAVRQRMGADNPRGDTEGVQEALAEAVGEPTDRPQGLGEWQATLAVGGDSDAGRQVFRSPTATCSKCHAIDGLGGTLGPSLANVAQSLSRAQIVRAILRPSDEFPPQYQAWSVTTSDGRVHLGLQLDHKSGGDIELRTTDDVVRHFEADEIEDYAASPVSIMPSGLEQSLTVSEVRDLVAFLMTLR